MNELKALGRSPYGWRSTLAILAGTVFMVGAALAEDKPLDTAAGAGTVKTPARVSPHVLAAQRRAQLEDDTLSPRVGLQSQMHKDAVRRHVAPARLGS